jgi:aspartyl-tRNA(Asn)/glutamyl-tRNA(Gln) amidotransferase subunit B
LRARLQKEWNIADKEMASMVNAGVLAVVIETVALGADPAKARSWWVGEIARQANERGVEVIDVGITPADVARIVELVSTGDLTDKLARQVVDGVIAGEGRPDEVVASRGLKVVSDDGALLSAIATAIASDSAAAEKVRGGNLNAAGALIGLVMKATQGQADAAKVRELLLKELGQ